MNETAEVIDENVADSTTILPNLDAYCWNDTDSCNIIGNFTRTTINLSFPVNIDCSRPSVNVIEDNKFAVNGTSKRFIDKHLYKRFHSIEVISLNGCGVSTTDHNNFEPSNLLGIDYIPDPLSVKHLTLEMFKIESELKSDVFAQFKNLKTLIMRNNHIESINRTSFNGLLQLNELVLQENSIESIDRNAFTDYSKSLQLLTIYENRLNLLELKSLPNIMHIDVSVKQLRWTIFYEFVDSLDTLIVSNIAKFDFNGTNANRTFNSLRKLQVVSSRLIMFPINRFPQLLCMNVSNNLLRNISLNEMEMINVKILDISQNEFRVINGTLLATLFNLEHFYAAHNQIQAINPKAFQKNFILKSIDIRFNRLKSLNLDLAIFRMSPNLKFMIDDNPWSCAWINKFYGDDPHVFALKFLYEKFTDRVNIKGLKCVFYGDNHLYHSHLHDDDDHYHLTGETRSRPPPPVEILRRNPKHTAVLTICILVVGVSCLLIMLYFYIKCRTVTSTLEPFYHTLPEVQRHKDNFDRRADIVRGRILPPTDYEAPLSNLEFEGIELGLKDILKPMHGSDEHFVDIEFKDLYEEIPEKHIESVDRENFDTMPIRAISAPKPLETVKDTTIN